MRKYGRWDSSFEEKISEINKREGSVGVGSYGILDQYLWMSATPYVKQLKNDSYR